MQTGSTVGISPGVEALGLLSSRAELQCCNFGQNRERTQVATPVEYCEYLGNETLNIPRH
jgi:hypothetical protein